ncbi:MAG: YgiT-type zinc finger protein [Thiotrichaceae bacterium]
MNTTKCDICGQEGAHIRYMTRSYGKGKHLFIIENIQTISCPPCGENYMTAETRHEIERIKLHKYAIAIERIVLVAEFI